MKKFLSIQNSYNILQICLFNDKEIVDKIIEKNIKVSKELILLLDKILKKNNYSLDDLDFITINQGPGAFITLRVLIATVNGISFAKKIPLIGIDGLKALLEEYQNKDFPINIALLNAFNKEVYYAVKNKDINTGYKNINELLEELKTKKNMFFIGNGTKMFKQEIIDALKNKAHFPKEIPETCTAKQVGLMALEKFNKNEDISYKLMPLYLKSFNYKKAIN